VSRKSARCEKGALRNLRPLALRLNGKFQPRQARIAHLGAQAQDVWRAQGFDAPKIKRFAFDQMVGVSTSTAKARAPDEAIEQTARFPRPTGSGIPVVPTDRLDPLPHLVN
jgi:hypothetical protein